MTRSVEHLVDMHRLAAERRAAGLPVWEHKVMIPGVFHNASVSLLERRDAVVKAIRESTWWTAKAGDDDFYELEEAVDELAGVDNEDDFDLVWDAVYDLADYDRVWIDTISSAP